MHDSFQLVQRDAGGEPELGQLGHVTPQGLVDARA
jgi:hypothetical protein